MIIKSRPTTLNMNLRKRSISAIRLKQVIQLLIIGVIVVNLCVIVFNIFLHVIGSW